MKKKKRQLDHWVAAVGLAWIATSAFAAHLQQATSAPSSSPAPSAVNSGVNQNQRYDDALTPIHQPNDKSDIALVAGVRRAIVKDQALSVLGHNVKIFAANGIVTLRGPVKSDDEKARIEADVKAVMGVISINNQLDIKQ